MVQKHEVRPSFAESQEHLVDFLSVSLTSDDGMAYQFGKKYSGNSENKEIARLQRSAGQVCDKDVEIDMAEMTYMTAVIFARETKGLKNGFWPWLAKKILKKFTSIGEKSRIHLSPAAGCMCQFATMRRMGPSWEALNKSMGKAGDKDFQRKDKFLYATELMYELIRHFPNHKEIIKLSYRTKLAEALINSSMTAHAKRRYERLLKTPLNDHKLASYFLADIYYHNSTFQETSEDKATLLAEANHHYHKCAYGRNSTRGLIVTAADLADAQVRMGYFRIQILNLEYALETIEQCQDLWRKPQSLGWIMQRAFLLAEAYCCVGKYSMAAEKYESALLAYEELDRIDRPSMLPHRSLGPYLKMRVDLNRAPANEANAIRQKYLEEVEKRVSQQHPTDESIYKTVFRRWAKASTLKSYAKNKEELCHNIADDFCEQIYMTDSFHKEASFRDRILAEMKVSEIFKSKKPHWDLSVVDISSDASTLFHIYLEAILQSARDGEAFYGFDDSSLTPPQREFLNAISSHANPNSIIFDDILLGYKTAIDLYDWNLPHEIFLSLKYLCAELQKFSGHYSKPSQIELLIQILGKLESLALNYSHPEDSYLVRRKLQNLYSDFAESLLGMLSNLDIESTDRAPALYSFISTAVERSLFYPMRVELDSNHFQESELQAPEVQDFLEKGRALAGEKRRMIFSEGEEVAPSEEREFVARRHSSIYGGSRRELDAEVRVGLRARQTEYDKSLDNLKTILPGFNLPSPYLRPFKQALPAGILRLHLFKVSEHIICVGYFDDKVAGASIRELDDASTDSSMMVKLGNLVDICVSNFPSGFIELLELCIQAPLETVPWLVLKDFVRLIPDNIPYRHDIGVGFASAFCASNRRKGTMNVVLGPPADRTDLVFGSLEFYTAWQQQDNSVRIALPADTNEFLAVAAEARILHLTGHFSYNEDSLMDSAITGLGNDVAGISLGFLQTQKLLVNDALVILNICESGRSGSDRLKDDISVRISDSPRAANGQAATSKALAATFLSKGASAVIATLWHVNDLPSFLFTRKLIQLLAESVAVVDAVEQAAFWLKRLSRFEALSVINTAIESAPADYIENEEIRAKVEQKLDDLEAGSEMPFGHWSDWAAYVVYGRGDL